MIHEQTPSARPKTPSQRSSQEQISSIAKRMQTRRKRFLKNQERDQNEILRLQKNAHREALRTHVGKDVVLSGNVSVYPTRLRARRGELATLERVGRTKCDIVFTGFESWAVPIEWIVPATDDEIENSSDGLIDNLNDSLGEL